MRTMRSGYHQEQSRLLVLKYHDYSIVSDDRQRLNLSWGIPIFSIHDLWSTVLELQYVGYWTCYLLPQNSGCLKIHVSKVLKLKNGKYTFWTCWNIQKFKNRSSSRLRIAIRILPNLAKKWIYLESKCPNPSNQIGERALLIGACKPDILTGNGHQ